MATDTLLTRFIDHNDGQAFAALIRCYGDMVYAVCLRVLGDPGQAADATQETFIQLLRSAGSITGSLGAWLHRVATVKAVDLIRHEARRQRVERERPAPGGEVTPEWQALSLHIDEALDSVDAATRELLIGYYLEQRSMASLARSRGISQPTISRRLAEATERLRHRLGLRGVAVTAALFTGLLKENVVQAAPGAVMRELGKMALAGQGTCAAAGTGAAGAAGRGLLSRLLAQVRMKLLAAGLLGVGTTWYLAEMMERGKKGPPAGVPAVVNTIPSTPEQTLTALERALATDDPQALSACFVPGYDLGSQAGDLASLGPPLVIHSRVSVGTRLRMGFTLRVRKPRFRRVGGRPERWQPNDSVPFVAELTQSRGQWQLMHLREEPQVMREERK